MLAHYCMPTRAVTLDISKMKVMPEVLHVGQVTVEGAASGL